ncbi:hypothetical protein GCM10011506_32540 [Marivirga lumbricoides]|uniref:Lipocalin-like domain-containing protein n=1 Tax=Marivirga lumbricoides TaxID=1046115 RepID=A0ABQ1MTS9_9BACT|nr:hypothetical protein GCM10011506_32540 [Marivirga lumbricoides]
MNKLNLLLLLIICTSCLPDEAKFEGFRRGHVQRLLSQGDQKIWLLEERVLMGEVVELDNCENARHLIFNFTSSATDSDSLWYVNYNKECNAQNDTLKGIWYIPLLNNAFAATDTVVFVWDSVDTAFFHLSTISPIELSVESISPNDSLTESFVADKEYEGLRVH